MDGEPKQGTPGWDSVDTSVVRQPDTTPSTQEIETPRFRKIFEVVNTKYPTPDYIKIGTDTAKKPFDQLDKEDQEYLKYLPTPYGQNLKQLAENIEATQVKDEEIQEYIDTMDTLSRNTVMSRMISNVLTGPETFVKHVSSEVRASETLERAKLWVELHNLWTLRYPRQEDTTEDDIKRDFDSLVTLLSGRNWSPKPESIPIDQTRNLANVYMDAFAVINSIEKQDDYDKPRVRNELSTGIHSLIEYTRNEENVRNLLDVYEKIKTEDPALVEKLLDITWRYAKHHGLNETTKVGLLTKLLPLFKSKDPQVDILQTPGNDWGMQAESFGAADFLVYSLTHKVTPLSINENLMALKEVPATTSARMEQNRKDALALSNPFGILRDFVHDQQPYVHELLTTMLDYYYTGNRTKLEGVLNKIRYFQEQRNKDLILDRARYDGLVKNEVDVGGEVPAIQVLKRLAENTIPVDEQPPQTSDNQLNQLMEQLDKGKSGGTVNRQQLQSTIAYFNTQLMSMMQTGEIGIEPNMIKAIAWLDQQTFRTLEGLSFEDQQTLFKTPLMRTLLLFEELTNSSSDFNQQTFDQFMEQINQSPTTQEAYKLMQARILNNVDQLASHYKGKGREHVIGALWSGNTTHTLIGLTDYKEAETVLGKRYKNEAEIRKINPSYHPGD